MNRSLTAMAAALALANGACAGGAPKQGSASVMPASQMSWSGNIRPLQLRMGANTPMSLAATYEGSVWMTRSGDDTTRTSVHFKLSTPDTHNESISWVLSNGRCGGTISPVLPITAFDPIDIGPNGGVDQTSSIPLLLPTDGTYQIVLFLGHSARLADMIACANLAPRK